MIIESVNYENAFIPYGPLLMRDSKVWVVS